MKSDDDAFKRLRADLRWLKWMCAANLAGAIVLCVRVFGGGVAF